MKILLWGCGESSQFLLDNKYLNINIIIGFIDNNDKIKEYFNKKVYHPNEIINMIKDYDYILVTTKDYLVNTQILNQIKTLNIPLEKIFFLYNYFRNIENHIIKEQDNEIIKSISEELFYNIVEAKKVETERLNDTLSCCYDLIDKEKIIGTGILNKDDLHLKDYNRYRTFELVANEIEKQELEGEVAELGVFRGTFSELINYKFSRRKLFLFDSFEGFRPDEYKKEKDLKNCDEGFQKVFENTSIDLVLDRMPYKDKCIIRKGFFPESIQEEEKEEKFVFVSLDVDFEESTYQGLKFFYPRLVENGYIFLHDYNNRNLNGVKLAVNRFEKDNNIIMKKVPISDEGGTLIIIK